MRKKWLAFLTLSFFSFLFLSLSFLRVSYAQPASEKGEIEIPQYFADVPLDHRNEFAIRNLKVMGVVSGDGVTGLFAPERPLNRAEFAKMIVEFDRRAGKAFEFPEYSPRFPDVPEGEWYTKYILRANDMGVLKGTGEGLAEPAREVLMVEALAMALRAFRVTIPDPAPEEAWYDPYLNAGRLYSILDDTILTAFSQNLPRGEAAQILFNTASKAPTFNYVGSERPLPETAPFTLTSVFNYYGGSDIPEKYTCDGANVNPPLRISGIPAGTQSLVLLVQDHLIGQIWHHWMVWNIPPDTTEIAENSVPAGAVQGINGWGNQKYEGPCPPEGERHQYMFDLFALDSMLDLDPATTDREALDEAIHGGGHFITVTTVSGMYGPRSE